MPKPTVTIEELKKMTPLEVSELSAATVHDILSGGRVDPATLTRSDIVKMTAIEVASLSPKQVEEALARS